MALIYSMDNRRLVELLGQLERRTGDCAPALETIGRYMKTSSIPLNFRVSGRPDPWARVLRGGKPLFDTGTHLAGSIESRVLSRSTLKVGTAARGARLHQFGGTVRPKQARALAVPLPGVKSSPRRFTNTFILHKGDTGDRVGVIVQKVGKRGRLRPLFVLRKQVTIPARPFLIWQPEDIAHAEQVLLQHLGVA